MLCWIIFVPFNEDIWANVTTCRYYMHIFRFGSWKGLIPALEKGSIRNKSFYYSNCIFGDNSANMIMWYHMYLQVCTSNVFLVH